MLGWVNERKLKQAPRVYDKTNNVAELSFTILRVCDQERSTIQEENL